MEPDQHAQPPPGGPTPAAERAQPPPTSAATPEFGPRGYLPERAAKRARKIVLRERLGLGWVLASVLAGAVVLAAGAWFVATQLGPPRPPFAETVAATAVPPGEAVRADAGGVPVLLVRAGGGVRAFAGPGTPVVLCGDSGHLEGADGTVWSLDGRRLSAAGDSLAELAVEVHAGRVYVDPTETLRQAEPRATAAVPACAPEG